MTQAHSTFSMLDKLSRSQEESRVYIDLLFCGFNSSVSDGLLSLLRGAGFSPRGRVVKSKFELHEVLGERSWDLIFARECGESSLSPSELAEILQQESREIPIIQLEQSPTYEDQHEAIVKGMAFLLPEQASDLIIARTTQILEQQRRSRRLHELELGLEQLSTLNQRLSEESTLATAVIQEGLLVQPNNTFITLFQLNPAGADKIPLQRIFADQSLKLIEQTLKNPTISLHETLSLRDEQGGEFDAQVELFTATPDHPNQRALWVDPMTLASPRTQQQPGQPALLSEQNFLRALETQLQLALGGGHDAFLLYFSLKTMPSTEDEQLLAQLRNSISRVLSPLCLQHKIALFDNSDIAVLIANPDRGAAKLFAQTVQAKLSNGELRLPGGITSISLSIGIRPINDSSPAGRRLLEHAKESVRSLGEQVSPHAAFTNPLQQQLKIEKATKALEDAIANQGLKLLYQPLVSLNEQGVERSYEILVRMKNGADKDMLPAQFLASLEHARVMVKLDRWVVENSLLELQRQVGPERELNIFINLSRRTLKSDSFAIWFGTMLDELGLSGNFVTVELSESDVAADLESALRLCEQLRVKNIGVCLKHFGCSTSSAKVYGRIKPDFVKIDGGFIDDLANPQSGPRAIRRLLETIDRKQTKAIAPLIEDAGSLPELYRMGFDLVQGYYLQPPQDEMRYEYFD